MAETALGQIPTRDLTTQGSCMRAGDRRGESFSDLSKRGIDDGRGRQRGGDLSLHGRRIVVPRAVLPFAGQQSAPAALQLASRAALLGSWPARIGRLQ